MKLLGALFETAQKRLLLPKTGSSRKSVSIRSVAGWTGGKWQQSNTYKQYVVKVIASQMNSTGTLRSRKQ